MSLFGRIFLTLTFVGVLVFGSTLAVTSVYRSEPLPTRWERLRDTLDLAAEEAVDRRNAGGQFAVDGYLAETGERMGLELWLTDSEGRSLSSNPLPTGLTPIVRSATVGEERRASVPWELTRARALNAPDGSTTVLVGRVPGGLAENLGPTVLRGLLAILIAVMVGYQLARSLAHPLTALRTAARAIAAGDLTARVGADRPFQGRTDELGALGRDFDAMATRLEAAQEAHRRLLADISHELRSPLARLGLALELARRRAGPEAEAAITRIDREAERMNRLIGELLELERLEADETSFTKAVALNPLLSGLAEDAAFEADVRGCRVEAMLPAEPIRLPGDPELLRRAVENVLRNAIRYSPPDSTVTLALDRDGDTVRIVVRDRGPGVPEESIAQLFDPFWRVGTDRDRASGGVGLGLSIAERAIRRHGGTIQARNAEGGGLEVRIWLPEPLRRAA